MKTNVKDSSILYINVALAVSIALILVFIIRPFFVDSGRDTSAVLKRDNMRSVPDNASGPMYDIDKVKRGLSGPAGAKTEYSDFEDMYKNCDRTNVGGNMVEEWRRVRQEDKAKISDGFDKQIAAAKDTLKTDPENKHAKNILYISEQLKKMSSDGFNYKLKSKKI